jgi:hypothetical protein
MLENQSSKPCQEAGDFCMSPQDRAVFEGIISWGITPQNWRVLNLPEDHGLRPGQIVSLDGLSYQVMETTIAISTGWINTRFETGYLKKI